MQFFPYSINFEDWVPILLGTISTYAYIMCVLVSTLLMSMQTPEIISLRCCRVVIIYIRKVGLVQMVSSRK